MRLRKPIIIFANKKKPKKRGVKRLGGKSIRNEQAATIENKADEQIPIYERFHSPTRKRGRFPRTGKESRGGSRLKTIALAVISAIIIGTCLGFIMLNMFDGITTATKDGSGSGGAPVSDTNDTENRENVSTITLEPLSAYVLQGGVFSKEERATDWVHKFQKADHPGMIWERENEFTLLAGVAVNEDQAKELAEDFTDEEIYVKEWGTKETEITVTNAESEWLKSFANVWEKSVEMLSEESAFPRDEWKQLLDQFPKQGEQLIDFQKQLQQSLSKVEKNDNNSAEQFLLDQWYGYEKIGKKEK